MQRVQDDMGSLIGALQRNMGSLMAMLLNNLAEAAAAQLVEEPPDGHEEEVEDEDDEVEEDDGEADEAEPEIIDVDEDDHGGSATTDWDEFSVAYTLEASAANQLPVGCQQCVISRVHRPYLTYPPSIPQVSGVSHGLCRRRARAPPRCGPDPWLV